MPVVIREATPREMLELALVENLQRADLNPLEAAQGYQMLIEEYGLTQEQVAERVGRNRATVANTIRLLQLPAEVREVLTRRRGLHRGPRARRPGDQRGRGRAHPRDEVHRRATK